MIGVFQRRQYLFTKKILTNVLLLNLITELHSRKKKKGPMHIIFWQLKSKFILCPSSFCIFSVKAKSKMKSTTLIDFHWVWAHLMISSANTRKCYPMNLSFERMEFTLHILLSEFNSFSHWTSLKWAGFVWFLDFFLLPWFCLV